LVTVLLGDFSSLSSVESSSIDLSSRSNLALVMRRSIYSTVAIIQKPIVVHVAIARSFLKCRATIDSVDKQNVAYGKNNVILGLLVVGSWANGRNIPLVVHDFQISFIFCNILFDTLH